MVHHGRAARVHAQRTNVLAAAYAAHPERFVNGQPTPADLPQPVLDQPAREEKSCSGCPRNDERHLGRPTGPLAFMFRRALGRHDDRPRRNSNYFALGVSMSLTASELPRGTDMHDLHTCPFVIGPQL